ncbi:LysR substrate-binding domain-containing protein [Bradyrhizobium centrolobii]|uniref:LysR substrate-binding domain-containing protein n=1 Tax=Bradyrhizobium centrolobii TaxID=1505087 RepID=UPI00191BC474|nr:LysR substrate-binding domain-containing protein [Bradyrhizobium centrolobii]
MAARKVLRWDDLRDIALVAASRDHEISVAQMRSSSPEAKAIAPAQIVDNITTAHGIAAHGLAATPAPAYVAVVARPLGLTMRRITKPETVREVCLYRPARRSIPPAAEAFGEFLVQWDPTMECESRPLVAQKPTSKPQASEVISPLHRPSQREISPAQSYLPLGSVFMSKAEEPRARIVEL